MNHEALYHLTPACLSEYTLDYLTSGVFSAHPSSQAISHLFLHGCFLHVFQALVWMLPPQSAFLDRVF